MDHSNTHPVLLEGPEAATPGQARPRSMQWLSSLLVVQRRQLHAESHVSTPGQKKGMQTRDRMGHRESLSSPIEVSPRQGDRPPPNPCLHLWPQGLYQEPQPKVGWMGCCHSSVRPRAGRARTQKGTGVRENVPEKMTLDRRIPGVLRESQTRAVGATDWWSTAVPGGSCGRT